MRRQKTQTIFPTDLRFKLEWEAFPSAALEPEDEKALGLFLYVINTTALSFQSVDVSFARFPYAFSEGFGLASHALHPVWRSDPAEPHDAPLSPEEQFQKEAPVFGLTRFENLGAGQIHKVPIAMAAWETFDCFWLAPVEVSGITKNQLFFSFQNYFPDPPQAQAERAPPPSLRFRTTARYTNLFVLEPLRNEPCHLKETARQREL